MPRPRPVLPLLLALLLPAVLGCKPLAMPGRPPVAVVAHVTDAHARPHHDAPLRIQEALRHLRKHNPEVGFVLNTGDTLDGADGRENTLAKWGFWKTAVERELKDVLVYSLLGNHDMLEGPDTDPLAGKAGAWHELGMPGRYYSFDRAGWHFIMLDSNEFAQDVEQLAWLKRELEVVPIRTPIAVLSHHPIFSMGAMVHSQGDHIGNWKELVALFAKHPNVKLCLSGHTHLYDECRYNGVTYICGGSLAGAWWEREKSTDGRSGYLGTRPGYGILRLFADGASTYEYVKHEN